MGERNEMFSGEQNDGRPPFGEAGVPETWFSNDENHELQALLEEDHVTGGSMDPGRRDRLSVLRIKLASARDHLNSVNFVGWGKVIRPSFRPDNMDEILRAQMERDHQNAKDLNPEVRRQERPAEAPQVEIPAIVSEIMEEVPAPKPVEERPAPTPISEHRPKSKENDKPDEELIAA